MEALVRLLMVAIAAPLSVVFGVAIWRRPQRGLLLIAGLVPFNGLLVLVPHPHLVEGWKEGLLCGVALLAFLRPAQPVDRVRLVPGWLAAVGMLILLGVAHLPVLPFSTGVEGLKVAFFYLLFVAIMWRHPFDDRDRDHLVGVFMATGVLTAAIGVAQQLVGAEALIGIGYRYGDSVRTAGGHLRAFSTFDQPFPFAFYLMVVLLIGVPVALTDLGRWRNRLFLAATPLLVAGLLSAIVRAALIGLAAGLLYLAVTRYRRVAHVGVSVMLLATFAPSGFTSVFASASSLTERTNGWNVVAVNLVRSPFGSGLGTVGAAAERATGEDVRTGDQLATSSDQPYQPDNHYLVVGLQLGVLGLWAFLAMVISALRHAHRLARRATEPDSALAAGIAAQVVGAAVAALTASYWEIFPLDLYFWMLLGVLTSLDLMLPNRSSARRGWPSTHWPSDRVEAGFKPTFAGSSAP